ncbi:hypothetical protein T459_14949 [Capsicum annuum]|uniref:1-phosphatidylinositol 4-kinase n=1 Tax=Capsicum annuum TaxID=4072 RepID=A0A2G2ZJ34_CAPAN|nr:hypothetical protein T459_14949 [Capsicum annuum]
MVQKRNIDQDSDDSSELPTRESKRERPSTADTHGLSSMKSNDRLLEPINLDLTSSKIKKLVHWQLFKKNEGNCEDMGPGIMNRERLRDEKFQRSVMLFDPVNFLVALQLMILRHAGNILVSRQGEEGRILLTPIDHGYCLPENMADPLTALINAIQVMNFLRAFIGEALKDREDFFVEPDSISYMGHPDEYEEPDSASVSESNRVDNITDDEYLSYKTSSEESDDSAACETLIQKSGMLVKANKEVEIASDVEMDPHFWSDAVDLYFIHGKESRGISKMILYSLLTKWVCRDMDQMQIKKSTGKEKEQALNSYRVEQCVDIELHLQREV